MKHVLLALLLAGGSSLQAQTTHHLQICEADFPDTISAFDSNAISYLWSNGDTTEHTIVVGSDSLTVEVTIDSFNAYTDTFVIVEWLNPTAQVSISAGGGAAYFVSASSSTFLDSCTVFYWNVDSTLTYFDSGSYIIAIVPWSPDEGEYEIDLKVCNCCGCDSLTQTIYWDPPGIADNQTEPLRLYPNPTENHLIVQGARKIELLRVFDLTGKMVIENSESSLEIDVSELSVGSYWLEVNDDGVTRRGRFLKR